MVRDVFDSLGIPASYSEAYGTNPWVFYPITGTKAEMQDKYLHNTTVEFAQHLGVRDFEKMKQCILELDEVIDEYDKAIGWNSKNIIEEKKEREEERRREEKLGMQMMKEIKKEEKRIAAFKRMRNRIKKNHKRNIRRRIACQCQMK